MTHDEIIWEWVLELIGALSKKKHEVFRNDCREFAEKHHSDPNTVLSDTQYFEESWRGNKVLIGDRIMFVRCVGESMAIAPWCAECVIIENIMGLSEPRE